MKVLNTIGLGLMVVCVVLSVVDANWVAALGWAAAFVYALTLRLVMSVAS